MGIFDKLKEPVFLKESSNAEEQLEHLKELEPLLTDEGKAKLKQDIKFLEYGIIGEKNIAFELKNSHMPMYILHDIYLEDDNLTAQIDYLVFTRKLCFIIECKNLFGDIEINNVGDFIRTTEFGGKKKKEGIYSPITQNQRHIELMKKIKSDNKSGFFKKMVINRYFEDFHKSIVVLANPKTVLNVKYAKKDVKNQVIRADQLVSYIKETVKKCKDLESSEESILAQAQSYLDVHISKDLGFTAKFDRYLKEVASDSASITDNIVFQEVQISPVLSDSNLEETLIFKDLRAYRLNKSREEKIKPYFIYNDNQLKDLISKMPVSIEMLKMVTGFGDVKSAKYGEDIIRIVKKYL